MRIDNQCENLIETHKLREALEFASRGIRDRGVRVQVRQRRIGAGWSAYTRSNNELESVEYDLVILAREAHQKFTFGNSRRILKKYPQRLRLRNPQDVVVYLTAYHWKLISQYRRHREGARMGTQYQCQKFRMTRFCEWRVATGRNQIVPIKEGDPFADWRRRHRAARRRHVAEIEQRRGRLITLEEDEA